MSTTTEPLEQTPAGPAAAERELPPITRKVKPSTGDRLFAGFSHVLLIFWSILVVGPMLWTFLTSFKNTREITSSAIDMPKDLVTDPATGAFSLSRLFTNYINAWTSANFGLYFFNTFIVVTASMVLVMLLGAMCAYVLARYAFPGSQLIYYLMLAGLTFPIFLAIVPLYQVLKVIPLPWAEKGVMLGSFEGLILTYVAFALPFTVFFLYAFFKSQPNEIAEAAQVDGAGHWTTFFRIMLPMAKPGLASVAIFNFLGLWNQLLLPLALNPKEPQYVLAQGIFTFNNRAKYETDFGVMFAAVIITIVPVLIIYIIFQRQLQGSVSQGTMK